MFRNYLKTAWRNLLRNKTFSAINIFGLALGIACSLLILLWIQDELNVDKGYAGPEVYNVYERVFSEGKVDAGPWTPGLLAAELKRTIPGIRYATAYWMRDEETLFTVGDKNLSLKGCHADSDFFKIFHYTLLEGSPAGALNDPAAIAISREMATAFFGNAAAALGQMIKANRGYDRSFKVTAVFDNVAANATQQFDFVINWPDQLHAIPWLSDWINRSPFTYIQLQPGTDPARVEAEIKNFITPYIANAHYGSGYHLELGLQRYDQAYLHNTFKNGVPDGGRIEYVKLFSLIAVFILLIACINFMNLATARSVRRAKEVGIRKAVGALRSRLIVQFIGEAMLLCFLAGVVAVAMAAVALPTFNGLTAKHILFPFFSPLFWLTLAALLVLTGFIAGSYPALFLSSLNAVKVLKGSLKFGSGALLFRKGLVVFQFVLSIVLITDTIIVSRQIHYVQTANLGFDKENLVYVPYQGDLGSPAHYQLWKQELSSMPGIAGVDVSTNSPSHIGTHVYDLDWRGKDPNTRIVAIHDGVGRDFMRLMNLHMAAGRSFSSDFPSDTGHVQPNYMINETLARMIGLKDPVGEKIRFFGTWGTIIGVVKDFNLRSLHDPIEPLLLYWGEDAGWGYTLIKTRPGQTAAALRSMETVFKQLEPQFPLRYFFADEEYQKLYNSDIVISKLSNGFSFLAILISCLGLLGLTIFTVEQRRKEIGVRKVVGATVRQIVMLLSRDIARLIALSTVVAVPLAWMASHAWLANFAYRTTVSWWIFALSGVVAMVIALATISYQAIKAALANPVKSLRAE